MKTISTIFPEKEKIIFLEEKISDPSLDEVLIKTTRTLISTGTEIAILSGRHTHHLQGKKDSWAKFPWHAGYINVGTIIKKGHNVMDFKEGDRILSTCSHSTYVKSNIKDIVKIPDNVSDEEATFGIICGIVFPAIKVSKISIGDSVAVIGLGLLGQLTTQFCKLDGAVPVIGVDLSDLRLDLARKNGCEVLLNPERVDLEKEVKNLTYGLGVDIAFEVTGVPKVFPQVLKLPRREGKVILLSSPHGTVEMDLYSDIHARGLTIIGQGSGTHIPKEEEISNRWTINNIRKFSLNLIGNNYIKVKNLISHRFNWREIDKAYSMLMKDRGSAMGVIIEW